MDILIGRSVTYQNKLKQSIMDIKIDRSTTLQNKVRSFDFISRIYHINENQFVNVLCDSTY